MKIGQLILTIGISIFYLDLLINAIYGVSEGEFLFPSVWHMLWIGILNGIIEFVLS